MFSYIKITKHTTSNREVNTVSCSKQVMAVIGEEDIDSLEFEILDLIEKNAVYFNGRIECDNGKPMQISDMSNQLNMIDHVVKIALQKFCRMEIIYEVKLTDERCEYFANPFIFQIPLINLDVVINSRLLNMFRSSKWAKLWRSNFDV